MTVARWVIDTNVVMDLWHFHDPALDVVRQAVETGQVIALADEQTLAELERVVAYPEFRRSPLEQKQLLDDYRVRCRLMEGGEGSATPLPRCRDGDDQKFLELAARGHARLLITRDRALLRLRRSPLLTFEILTPMEWLKRGSTISAG